MIQVNPQDVAALFDGAIAVQAPLGPEALAAIPAKRGVFLLEGPGGQPLLLSTAADIRARMRFRLAPAQEQGPTKRVDLRELATAVRWRFASSHFETDWRFLCLARIIYPKTYRKLITLRPASFLHIDPEAASPMFRKTTQPLAEQGRYFGPFLDKTAAGRYAEVLLDTFDVCRHEQIMPGTLTSPCVYAQMGRCQAPSCSPATLDEYRALVKMACRCAGGELPAVHAELSERMKAMAADQQYERAARIKARLSRLAELEREEFAHVGPAEDYRYVLIQTGRSFSKARTFLFACGAMREGPGLDFPPPESQAAAVLDQARALPMPPRVDGEVLETMSLVTHYLFSPPQRRGLAIRVTAELSPVAIVEQVVAAADVLGLHAPKPRASRKTGIEKENKE